MKMAIMAALIALIVSATVALGQTNHIVGAPGPVVTLKKNCKRPVFVHQKIGARLNIVAQQVKCVVRRADAFAVCVQKLGPPPPVFAKFDHGPGKPGDWLGVDKVRKYELAIFKCASAKV